MSRFVPAFLIVVLLCAMAVGCGEDSPAEPPAPTPAPTKGTVVVNPSPDSLAC